MINRKAMIMAAGKGTRLLPLTKDRPKSLAEYKGKTLLKYVLETLKQYNFSDIIINVHHFPELITKYLDENNNFGLNIHLSDESDELLETGGGLKKASWFFNSGPFLVHNVDVQTEINLDELFTYHLKNPALATLAVKNRDTTRPFLMDQKHLLCGWKNLKSKEEIIARNEQPLMPVGFSCVYILDPLIFKHIHEAGKFSITPVLLRLARDHKINMFLHNGEWKDLGNIASYNTIEP